VHKRATIGKTVCEVHDGYLTFRREGQKEYEGAYLSRTQAIKLLRWLVPLVRQMTDDHDVEKAVSAWLAEEEQLAREILKAKGGRRRRLRGV